MSSPGRLKRAELAELGRRSRTSCRAEIISGGRWVVRRCLRIGVQAGGIEVLRCGSAPGSPDGVRAGAMGAARAQETLGSRGDPAARSLMRHTERTAGNRGEPRGSEVERPLREC